MDFDKVKIGHIGDPIPKDITCKCCGGSGVQRNAKTGLNVVCPCCNGSGVKHNIGKPHIYITE
jgi:DnaJ-class molecular chaperone